MHRSGRAIGAALLAAALLLLAWYAAGEDVRLFALGEADGRAHWSAALPADAATAGVPVAGDGRVVVGTARRRDGTGPERWRLSAFDAATGRRLWEYAPDASEISGVRAIESVLVAPLATPDRVYARIEADDGDVLVALDAATGIPAWTFGPAASGRRSLHADVATGGGRVAVPSRAPRGPRGDEDRPLRIEALDAADGAPRWTLDLGPSDFSDTDFGPFLAADEQAFYVGLGGALLAIDAEVGSVRYRIDAPANESGGQVVVAGGTLYWRSGIGTIGAYDARSGAPRWTYRQPFDDRGGALRSFRVLGDDLVAFCACETRDRRGRGWLLAADARTGQERWRAPLDAYIELYTDAPAIGAEHVLTGSEREAIVARSRADGAERWRVERRDGRAVGVADGLAFATDRGPRWRHWLRSLGWGDPERGSRSGADPRPARQG